MSRYLFLHTLLALGGIQGLFLVSCTNSRVENISATSAPQDSAAPVRITIISDLPDSLQPETILLENTPAPETVHITGKRLSFLVQQKSGQRTVSVDPVKKIKASLTPVMTRYTTEQGLALDVMAMGMADKKGNLWFGTSVNGVSKYDGHSFTNYSTAHGLADNKITRISEDREGNIWFATEGGASKFDGHTFTTVGDFTYVSEIHEDRNGNIWICDINGLYKYANDSIKSYTESDGLLAGRVASIEEDHKGNIWVGTDNGLFKYDDHMPDGHGKTFAQIALSKQTAYAICIDNSGSIWAAIPSGYIKYDARQPGHELHTGNYPFNENNYYRSIYKDRLGNIWMTGEKNSRDLLGNILLSGDRNWVYTNSADSLNQFYDFEGARPTAEDRSGNLWFATSANGVVKYSGPAFQQLISQSLRSIYEDKEGNLWTTINGLTRFDGEYFTTFQVSFGIWSIIQDRSGAFWLGGSFGDGMIKFEDNSFTFYTDLNGLVDNSVRFMIQDNAGYLWIGTEKGLSKFDGKSFTNFTKKQGLPGDLVSCIVEDRPGQFLLGTDGGLSIFDGKSFNNYSINRTTQGNDVRSIIKDKQGNLWMATYGGGLCRYDGKSFYTYTTEQGLPDNVLTQVALTKEGNIIVGTNNGIALLTGFKSASNAETTNSNIPSKDFHSSFPSPEGEGARKADEVLINYPAQNNLSNSELKNLAPVFEIYNPKTGYPVMDVNRGQHAIFEDSKGILWIASGSEKSGLMRFDYSSLYKNNNPPALNILSVKVDNERVCWRDLLDAGKNDQKPKSQFESIPIPASVTEEVTTFGKTLSDAQREEMRKKYEGVEFDSVSKFYPVPQNLKLPHGHNNVTIEFAAIEPDKPSLVQYQYMLEGYDKNWSTPANISSATFGNMYEGTYKFKLKARSPSGIWCEPITYTFTVLPPWWRTWWARTLFALAIIGAVVSVFRYRTRALRFKQKELETEVNKATIEIKKQNKELMLTMENLKATQEELLKSEKLAAFGTMATRMAHEIQNPLNFVNNFSDISKELMDDIRKEATTDEAKQEAINLLSDNLEKIYHHGRLHRQSFTS